MRFGRIVHIGICPECNTQNRFIVVATPGDRREEMIDMLKAQHLKCKHCGTRIKKTREEKKNEVPEIMFISDDRKKNCRVSLGGNTPRTVIRSDKYASSISIDLTELYNAGFIGVLQILGPKRLTSYYHFLGDGEIVVYHLRNEERQVEERAGPFPDIRFDGDNLSLKRFFSIVSNRNRHLNLELAPEFDEEEEEE